MGRKEQCREKAREWHITDYARNKDSYRNRNFLARYGITLDEYNEMSESQGHVCAICGNAETSYYGKTLKSLAVDHCHQSNAVRGLLCSACNRGLGFFRDNPETLLNAANYLRG